MTCIAADLTQMAGDSRITGDVMHNVTKVRRVKQSIFGVAGDWDACARFYAWLDGGEKPQLGDVSFEAMELTKDGIYLWTSTLTRYRITSAYHAIGSGGLAAKCLLSLGVSPTEAVDTVAKFCESVGGPTICLSLQKSKPSSRR